MERDGKIRCPWAGDDPLYAAYHDEEWGRPLHEDRALFELLILEGMQAGLSWITILRKREAFREAFEGFEPSVVARFDEEKVAALLQNPGIVRNGLKVRAAITNARAFLEVQREFGSFDRFLWAYADGTAIQARPRSMAEVPANTPRSDDLSRELKRRGFRFVGSTIVYSFMQSAGLVNDHLADCFAADAVSR
ncbi:MAG: DNA-3-methyladenine glycosylase I [Oscillospiraceae bacterium]|nr:DNA-3-methyladenine glycosylase I [Oscillospiraceae bacterium]